MPHRRPAKSPATPSPPPHPGEVLYSQFLVPRGITETALARHVGRPVNAVNDLVCQRRTVSTEMAVLLAAALGTTARFWLDLRSDHDLWRRREMRVPPPLAYDLAAKPRPGRPRRVPVARDTGREQAVA